jgi:hypothetical protein
LLPGARGWSLTQSAAGLALLVGLLVHLGCQAAAPASTTSQAGATTAGDASVRAPAPAAQAREAPPAAASTAATGGYDLSRDEARGGHTLGRHVGRSDADLKERLRREQISAASTYSDRTTAERVVARALAGQRGRVNQWLARQGSRPNLALDYHGQPREIIGRSLTRRSAQTIPCTDAVVVLRSDGGRGFIVLTSYPEISR